MENAKKIYFIRTANKGTHFSETKDFVVSGFKNSQKSYPNTFSDGEIIPPNLASIKKDYLKSFGLSVGEVEFEEVEITLKDYFAKWTNRLRMIHKYKYDKKAVEKAIKEYYEITGHKAPEIRWEKSPKSAYDWCIKNNKIADLDDPIVKKKYENDNALLDVFALNFYFTYAITDAFPAEVNAMQFLSSEQDPYETLVNAIQLKYFNGDNNEFIQYKNVELGFIAFADYCLAKCFKSSNDEITEKEYSLYLQSANKLMYIFDELNYFGMFWMFGATAEEMMGLRFFEKDSKEYKNRLAELEQKNEVITEDAPSIVVFSEHPIFVSFVDGSNRLHNMNRKAFEYADGFGACYVENLLFEDKFVLDPQNSINVSLIDAEPNIERRRILMNLYGYELYITNSKAEVLDKSSYGTLYKKSPPSSLRNEEDLFVVELTNSTPEPDGTYKKYFLRVPPEIEDNNGKRVPIKTAKAAVAWSFSLREKEYSPISET